MRMIDFRTCFALVLMLIYAVSTSANDNKLIHVKKVDSEISIDGEIDPLWGKADSVSDFIQFQPYHNVEPSYKTKSKLLSTQDALFCLIICHEDRSIIQENTGQLDDHGGDVVSLMIDTFGDERTAYKFAVTASGVRSDCRMLDDARNRDYSWDGVWFSHTKIYDWGFVVEMKIPYRSIKYDETFTEWGLDFDRWIAHLNEDIYWCQYEVNEGQRISKFGKLVFDDFRPAVKSLNLEIFPVGIAKAECLHDSKYDLSPNAGVDVFYNPSQRLTFQLTANPDFAQIEADPYDFNISRYESYFKERRPFFTEGNEVFMPSGKERGSGFYTPLELFYSRRIGKKLPDGSEVPFILGTKGFGRIGEWEYGGFLAATGEKDYSVGDEMRTEPEALFTSFRLKRQILHNSNIGLLYVGKNTEHEKTGVIDIDGAFRSADWQLSYQLARSYKNDEGDFAASTGMLMFKEKLILGLRGRYIGKDFDVNQVGFVPWQGTGELIIMGGPRWYFDKGYIKQVLFYGGGILNHERVDAYTDRGLALGFNMQFRNNWGYEINLTSARSKDLNVKYTFYQASWNSWYNISPRWNGNLSLFYAKTYNFARDYLAYYGSMSSHINWRALDVLDLGTSLNVFIEETPDHQIEDITINARPFFSWTPINNLNIRVYLDNLFFQSTERIERMIGGFLFSYNFRPKSWIYFAINEVRERSTVLDSSGRPLPNRLHVVDRASVFKVKYLFYF